MVRFLIVARILFDARDKAIRPGGEALPIAGASRADFHYVIGRPLG